MLPALSEQNNPGVVFTRTGDPWVTAQADALHAAGATVVHLDGRELAEPGTLMDAFARELSFPGYFGRNWDALTDCLNDWHRDGTPGNDRAVLIDHADGLLHAGHLGVLVAVLCQAAWPDGHGDRPAQRFVLLLDEATPDAFAGPASTDADVRVALTGGRLTATLSGTA